MTTPTETWTQSRERERQERKARINELVERLVASTLPKPQPRTTP